MRIITGKYKGRHFDIPRSFKARPTTDFAKENIFNVLVQYVDFEGATALDLFSGTGSISLELLSRGCQQVISVELDRDHHRFITDCIGKLGWKVEGGRWRENTSSPAMSSPDISPSTLRPSPSTLHLPPSTRHLPPSTFHPIRGDVFRYIKSCKQQFDFVFADPPYALKELPQIPDLILGTAEANSSLFTLHSSLLKPEGIFVLEHGKDYDFSQHPHFLEHRSYGSVNFSLFR